MDIGIVSFIVGLLITLLWMVVFIIADNFFGGTEFETFMSDYCFVGMLLPAIFGLMVFLVSILV